MAEFTATLKRVIEITDGEIGLDEYPIFDPDYRAGLNKKIIDHYLNREIGQESIPMFVHALKRRMNEIMPYYNQLYESERLKIENPLLSFSTTTENTSEVENESTSESESQAGNQTESTGQSRTVSSETPQTRLAGDEDYASAAQDAASTSLASGTATDHTTASQDGVQRATATAKASGFNGPEADLLLRYRQTFLNIDVMVINDLADLFMLIWSTGDSYTQSWSYPLGPFGYYF